MFEISDPQRPSILTDTTSMLGELHWYLLRSSKLMSDKRSRVLEEHSFGLTFERRELTDFGHEVGRDEIDWWVNSASGPNRPWLPRRPSELKR
jgi:hypothetical protein